MVDLVTGDLVRQKEKRLIAVGKLKKDDYGRRNANWIDASVKIGAENCTGHLHINTVDTLADGETQTSREDWQRIKALNNMATHDHFIMIPKAPNGVDVASHLEKYLWLIESGVREVIKKCREQSLGEDG